eukprot:7388851-Prymnesium_polylepis.1
MYPILDTVDSLSRVASPAATNVPAPVAVRADVMAPDARQLERECSQVKDPNAELKPTVCRLHAVASP